MTVTLVSLVPRPINEQIHHIYPDRYFIEAAKENDFEILHIGDGTDQVYALDGKHIARTVPANVIAEDIINGMVNSTFGVGENSRPGLFYLEGKLTKAEIKDKHSSAVAKARLQQINWFKRLVARGDDDWQKFRQHAMISDLHRDACRLLGEKRDWLLSDGLGSREPCPACGSLLPNKDVTICGQCRTIINPKEHEKRFKVSA